MSFRPRGMATRSPPPKSLPQRSVRRGFTLVELLIAMALTLILVYAVARFFSFVGETVRDGRAQTEMGGQLRAAFLRLQQDFSEMTVRVGGRIDPGSGMGCLELWEGIASDMDPNGDGVVNANGISDEAFRDPNGDSKPDGLMLGDCDDILVMTVRSEGEPYVGRMCQVIPNSNPVQFTYSTIRSNLAEVIWFTTFKDLDNSGLWEPTEPRYLVRRQLLIISPDQLPPGGLTAPPGQNFFHHNDISAHAVLDANWNFVGFATNSLGDLSRRENRFVHQNLANLNQNGLRPNPIAMGAPDPTQPPNFMPNSMQLNVGTMGFAFYSLDGILQFAGEDKVLSNVMAFDVRVLDPFVPLRADNADISQNTPTTDDDAQGVLSPGDPGYAFAVANNFPSYLNNPPNGIGMGAYVDLWYNRSFGNNTALYQNSAYSWAPNVRSYTFNPNNPNLPVGSAWDTWTNAYEKDGRDQFLDTRTDWMIDGLDNDTSGTGFGIVDDPSEAETQAPYPSWPASNGYDDDGQNGVDDPAEQAVSYPGTPPRLYPVPTTLRGIEVRIRMYEPGTRQTRQATVHTDFIPE